MTSADIGFVPTVIVHYEAGKPHDIWLSGGISSSMIRGWDRLVTS
jgi:hypothetical protein